MTYTDIKNAIKESDKDTVQGVIGMHGEEVLQSALDAGVPVDDIEECYQGEFNTDEDFVMQLLDDTCVINGLPSYVHIDWERTANDVMMDYTESNGHYFRNL